MEIDTKFNQFQEDIKLHFHLNYQFPSGFYYLKCPICDKGDSGFYFDNENIIFNCFRAKCRYSAVMKKGEYVPKKFRQLIETSGLEIPPDLLFSSNQQKKIEEEINKKLFKPVSYDHVGIPEHFEKVTKNKHKFIIKYLENRYIDFDELPHELYTTNKPDKWFRRIIFPMYFHNKIIGFQGKKIDERTSGNKYETESFKINKALFYAPLGYIPKKVFLVEGIFDALSIPNGLALLSSNVSKGLAYLLRNHEVVIIPDRGNIKNTLKDIRKYEYRASIPDIDCKDMNEAIQKYGRIVTTKKVMDGIESDPYKIEVKLNLWDL